MPKLTPLSLVAVVAALSTPALADSPHRRTGGDPVRVTVALGAGRVLRGSDGATHLMVELTAPQLDEAADRPPLNVALVLDRSGSMRGNKLRYAVQAAKAFVERMADGDTVSVVTYDNRVQVVVPSTRVGAHRERISRALSRITARGNTNLSEGLSAGIRQVRARQGDGTVDSVMLLSDGKANKGITNPTALAQIAANALQYGVTVTTIGLGIDYNESLMRGIAHRGRGGYHYIRDARALAGGFETRLLQLTTTVARNVRVRVRPADGVRIGDAYADAVRRTADGLSIRIGDLHGGRVRKLLFPVTIDADAVGSRPVATVEVEYDTHVDWRRKVRTVLGVGVEIDSDGARVGRSADADVVTKLAEVQASRALDSAVADYRSGNTARARSKLASLRKDVEDRRAVAGRDFLFDEMEVIGKLEGALAAPAPPPAASPAGRDFIKSLDAMAPAMAE